MHPRSSRFDIALERQRVRAEPLGIRIDVDGNVSAVDVLRMRDVARPHYTHEDDEEGAVRSRHERIVHKREGSDAAIRDVYSGTDPASKAVCVVPSLGVLGANKLAVLDEALRVKLGRHGVDFGIEVEGPMTCEEGRSFRNEVA